MRILLVVLFLGFSQSSTSAQIRLTIKDTTVSSRDSIMHHYLRNGAWKHSIHSKEYGRYIDSALTVLPHDAYLWQQKGMPYFKEMKYDVGMPYIDSAVKYDSLDWLDYRAFLKCIFQKHYQGAIYDLNAAKRLRPGSYVMDHPYDFYIGLCYLQLSQFDSARAYLQSVVARDSVQFGPSGLHYLHMLYLGIANYELERNAEAIGWFDKALLVYDHFSDAKYYKALALARRGDVNESSHLLHEAREDFSKGYTINEDNAVYERYPYQVTNALLPK